jgi:ACS family hexuronate transporter-like MFS transporter
MKLKKIKRHPSYAWLILGLITGMHVMNIFSGRSIIPLAPLLQVDLNLSHFQIGMFTSIYFAGAFFFSFPMGWLVDKIGVYWTMPLGQLIVGFFIICLSMADSFIMICILLFLGGIGHAAINPATAKVVMAWFPLNRRATAMGVKQTGVPIGSALAAAALPAIALSLGWQKAFVISGLVSIASVFLSLIIYRKPTYDKKNSTSVHLPPIRVSAIFKNKDIMLLSVLMIGFLMLQSSLETYIVFYCMDVLKYTLITSGLLLSISQLGAIGGRLFWGPVSDIFMKAKRKSVLMVIGGISSIMCLVFALMPTHMPIWVTGGLVIIFGACAIGWNAIYLVFAAELAGRGNEGRAIGISLTIAFIGHLIGAPIFGHLVDSFGSYTPSWLLFSCIMAITTLLIAFIREPQK